MKEYLVYLKSKYDELTDRIERSVFWLAMDNYRKFIDGVRDSKHVTKKTIVEDLVDKGILSLRRDGSLPDDRRVRQAARELLKRGYPILADSTVAGFYIVDDVREISLPQKQNKNRALNILAVDKGYDKVRQMLGGQEVLREVM